MAWPEYSLNPGGVSTWPMLAPQEVEDYGVSISTNIEAIQEIRKETETEHPRLANMLMPTTLCMLLRTLVSLMDAKVVVEIGTFTGYATKWLAAGLSENGKIITYERFEQFIPDFNDPRITAIHGDAVDKLPELDEQIDIVLVDGAKYQYWECYELVLPKVKSNGIIIFDNTLWAGMAMDPPVSIVDAESIAKFNKDLCNDDRVEVTFIPAWDGLTIARKK